MADLALCLAGNFAVPALLFLWLYFWTPFGGDSMEGEVMAEGYGDMPGGKMLSGPMRDPPIPTERRRHLCRMAEAIADRVEKETTERERHLLRRMLSNLLDW